MGRDSKYLLEPTIRQSSNPAIVFRDFKKTPRVFWNYTLKSGALARGLPIESDSIDALEVAKTATEHKTNCEIILFEHRNFECARHLLRDVENTSV